MNEIGALAIAQRYFDETTRNRLSEELFSPDVVLHNYFLERYDVQGIEQVRAGFDLVYGEFPDTWVSIQDVIADADKIVVLHTHHGTFTAAALGVPSTGQVIAFEGVEILRIADGKIAEIWNFDDNATAFRQMGLLDSSPEYGLLVSALAQRAQARSAR